MSAFRDLLKGGDKGAKAIHDAFNKTRDRDAFQVGATPHLNF